MKKLLILIVCVLAIVAPVSRNTPQPTQVKSLELYDQNVSVDGYIRAKKDRYYEELKLEMIEQKKVKRILRGGLKGQEEKFLNGFESTRLAKYVMAVICSESGCGEHQCGSFNYSGIMKNGKCQEFNSVEDYIENGIKKRTGKYFRDLDKVGVSRETLNDVFIGQGKYCTSGCSAWVDNFLFYYNKIK
tara:strand:- start:213 stop:776 length:564 start_codon:yes stop_codon:yes gene_type:complete